MKISPEPLGLFQPNLIQRILGLRGFKFVQMKGHTLSQRTFTNLPQKHGLISTSPVTKHHLGKENQFCTNEGPRRFQKGDNAKIH